MEYTVSIYINPMMSCFIYYAYMRVIELLICVCVPMLCCWMLNVHKHTQMTTFFDYVIFVNINRDPDDICVRFFFVIVVALDFCALATYSYSFDIFLFLFPLLLMLLNNLKAFCLRWKTIHRHENRSVRAFKWETLDVLFYVCARAVCAAFLEWLQKQLQHF